MNHTAGDFASGEFTTAVPLVAGEWGGSGEVHEICDPARPSLAVGRAQHSSPADVSHAYAAAARVARTWAEFPAASRAGLLYRAADLLDRDLEASARDLVLEEGKILADSRGEVQRSAATLRYYAGALLQPSGHLYPPENATLSLSRRVPVGVVTVITPFNYPMLLPAWKIGAALAYGNVVVWKCSELVPLSAWRFARALDEAGLPPGVLNLLIGGVELAEPLMDSADFRALTFTGSTKVGRQLATAVAGRGIRLQLELGGKNPAVVLDSADPLFAADSIAKGSMSATGQKCTAISLAIATPGIYDDLRDALAERISRLRLGHGLQEGTEIGPLITATAAARVHQEIVAAQDRGATLVTGHPRHPDEGHFVTPTVLEGAADRDPLLTHEVFGPLLLLVRATDEDDAVARANNSPFGLNAALFTSDLDSGVRLAQDIHAGMVHVNAVSGFPPHIPFGGVKASGFGPLEQGDSAAEFFTETRILHIHAGSGRP
ncbi:MAG: aldehyde dehydrogenase family protein [bacterium]|nr:aldehyde dehydrogenase family protein [bacterium]